MQTLMKVAMKVQESTSNSGGKWGTVSDGSIRQVKKSRDGAIQLVDGEGRTLTYTDTVGPTPRDAFPGATKASVPGSIPLLNGEGRPGSEGRSMEPGQMVTRAAIEIRKKRSNVSQPKITKTTGGLRKMKSGPTQLENSVGKGL